MYFSIYEGSDSTGEFQIIHQVYIPNSDTGQGWFSSGVIDVILEANKYYAITTSWYGYAEYFYG